MNHSNTGQFEKIAMKKINTVMLIDDDEGDNYYHRLIIEESGIAQSIKIFYYAEDALEHLWDHDDNITTDLIFLDINMPRMNGFEFIEQYAKIENEHKPKTVIVMLSTSLSPGDKTRLESSPYIAGFINKPLSQELLKEVLVDHFPQP